MAFWEKYHPEEEVNFVTALVNSYCMKVTLGLTFSFLAFILLLMVVTTTSIIFAKFPTKDKQTIQTNKRHKINTTRNKIKSHNIRYFNSRYAVVFSHLGLP